MTAALLLDWDGTVVDSRETLLASWRAATVEVIGRPFPRTEAERQQVFSIRGAELFAQVTADQHEAERLARAFDRHYEGSVVHAFPGIGRVLRELTEDGVRLAVVSSKARTRWQSDVTSAGLADLFEVAICAEDVFRPKPDPEPVNRVLEVLGLQADCVAMLGDTTADLRSASAAGVTAIAASWGYGLAADLEPLADVLCSQVGQLPELLKELRAPRSSRSLD